MVEGSCMNIAKFLVFFSNLLFVIFGILLISLGFINVENREEFKFFVSPPSGAYVVLILIGFSIFFVAFLGCYGALRENHCMLLSFGSVMFVLLVVELIAAGLVFKFKDNARSLALKSIERQMEDYGKNDTKTVTDIIDDLQITMNCCGAESSDDWKRTSFFHEKNVYPLSCCEGGVNVCKKPTRHAACVTEIEDRVRSKAKVLGSVALIAALIQLLGIMLSCTLARTFKKGYEVV